MEIDWEQRRYETAKEILSHLVGDVGMFGEKDKMVVHSLYLADSLTRRLKALNESE